MESEAERSKMKVQRPNTLITIPVANGESLEEYIERAGQAALENNLAICATIDRTIGAGYRSFSSVDSVKATPNTINGKYQHNRRKTLADIAADNPLIADMLKAGF
jgi:hypothetical protein